MDSGYSGILWDLGQTSMEEPVPWLSVWHVCKDFFRSELKIFWKKISIILQAGATLMENTDKYEPNFIQHLVPRKLWLFTEKQLSLEMLNFMSKLQNHSCWRALLLVFVVCCCEITISVSTRLPFFFFLWKILCIKNYISISKALT